MASALIENIIADATNWVGDDADGQTSARAAEPDGPCNVAPDVEFWVAGQGGGNGLVTRRRDATVSSGQAGYNLTRSTRTG